MFGRVVRKLGSFVWLPFWNETALEVSEKGTTDRKEKR